MIQRTKGAQSIVFAEAPYIMSSASVVGKKESEGPLGELFDTFDETNLFGEETWELAEGVMQREACVRALHKANVTPEQVRYLLAVICCVRGLLHRWEQKVCRFHCLDCSERVLHPVRHWHLQLCAWQQDMENGCSL